MKERQPKLSKEEAKKALQNAEWARTIGVVYAATGLLIANIQVPVELKAFVLGVVVVSGLNAGRRSLGERQAMEEFPGVEKEP